MASNVKFVIFTWAGLPLIASNISRAPLERSTLTTLARCWAGCPTPTASALRCERLDHSSHASTQDGYCGITFKEVSSTTPDAFNLLPPTPTPTNTAQVVCPNSFVYIPQLRWYWKNLKPQKFHFLVFFLAKMASMVSAHQLLRFMNSSQWLWVEILKNIQPLMQCGAVFGVLAPPATSYGPLALTSRLSIFVESLTISRFFWKSDNFQVSESLSLLASTLMRLLRQHRYI